MPLTEGQNVGPYRIVAQLGFGGMATVYKAYHARLDRYVAIKVMHQAFQEDETFLARFQREAQIVARLEHPHIVQVYDFAEHENQPYLVMKYVEGRTLKGLLTHNPPTLSETLRILTHIADALDYAHRAGVLHRDIKPSNIILASDGTPYITDFGLARMAQINESTLSADVLLGTPHYISPEQAMGSRELTSATDLYSLGVVVYELFTGRVPYTSDTPFAVIHSHIYSPLPKPSAINPEISPELEAVLSKALAKNPADRYPTARDMMNAVKEAITASNMTTLDPQRVQHAQSLTGEIPPTASVVQPPVIGGTQARLDRLSKPAALDPDETAPPIPLASKDASVTPADSTPSARFPLPNRESAEANARSGAPAPQPPRAPGSPNPMTAGGLAGSIGGLVGSAARLGIESAARAISEANVNIQAEIEKNASRQGKPIPGAKIMHRSDDGAQIAKLPNGGVHVRTKYGVELRFDQNDTINAPWWNKIKDGEWEEALNEIIAENDEIAPPDDTAAIRRRAEKQMKERNGFMMHLIPFVLVNLVLLGIAGETSADGGFNWAVFPLFGWGAGLAAHWVNVYYRTGMREARRIAAIQRAYRAELGERWYTADKNHLKEIRRRVNKPYQKRREFFTHFAVYIMINLMLQIAFGPGWTMFALFGWGVGLVAHAADTFGWSLSGESQDRHMEKMLQMERSLIGESEKRKNDESEAVKRKNDEPDVRLNEDGEFTDSMVEELEENQRRRRGRR